jgi:multicomponent Na+:H+ antiporter subunit F
MNTFLLGVAAVLLLNVAAGLTRVARGPTRADRMVAAQLFGTTGVAVLLTLAQAMGEPALRDLALVVVLLAVVISVAFVKRGWVRQAAGEVGPEVGGGSSGAGGDQGG